MINKKLFVFFFFILSSLYLVAQDPGYQHHKVKPGETRYGISRQYEMSLRELDSLNPQLAREGMKAGQVLIVAQKAARQISAQATKAIDSNDFFYHKVLPGETLYSLLRKFNVSSSLFDSLNPRYRQEGLKVGDLLRFPKTDSGPDRTSQRKGQITHEVKAGETAYSLAKKYRVSLDSLYLLNPGAREGLALGQKLVFPENLSRQAQSKDSNQLQLAKGPKLEKKEVTSKAFLSDGDYFLYKIKSGDTFYSLLKRQNITKETILKLNPELKDGLKVGKYIILPNAQEPEQNNWLDRLFNKVEPRGAEDMEPLEETTRSRKEKLNQYKTSESDSTAEKEAQIRIDGDSLRVEIEKEYKVAVVLPFMALPPVEPLNAESPREPKWQANSNSEMAIQFYHGLYLAADSLRKKGMPLRLKLYDSQASLREMEKLVPLLKLDQPDLIIGPAYRKNVEFLADALSGDAIPILSPLSRGVDVKHRPNLIQLVTGDKKKNQKIAELINQSYDSAMVLFAHCGDENALADVQEISARIEARKSGFISNILSCESFKSRIEFREQFNQPQQKVVVVLSDDPVFLSDLTAKLSGLRDTSIHLIGSPKLLELPTIELSYLEKLHFTTYEVRSADYDNRHTQLFIQRFREQFSFEPSLFALQGYDAGLFFLQQLWQTGPFLLESLSGVQATAQATGFDLQRNVQGGIENHFLFLTGVRKFQLVRLD